MTDGSGEVETQTITGAAERDRVIGGTVGQRTPNTPRWVGRQPAERFWGGGV